MSRPVPATDLTHGPWRKVVGCRIRHDARSELTEGTRPDGQPKLRWVTDTSGLNDYRVEVLACGHLGHQVRFCGHVDEDAVPDCAKTLMRGHCPEHCDNVGLAKKRRCHACLPVVCAEVETARAEQARRNGEVERARRAEMATPAGQEADVEAKRRRSAFRAFDGGR